MSVEGGKTMPPLQFSFTFYDLEGHHGKITKDDIVGIVYTIYESLGKSVMVPHCGSKTINVRLTVSPEGKNGASKNKKASSAATTNGVKSSITTTTNLANHTLSHHLHRHHLRKHSKLDDEHDEDRCNVDEAYHNTNMSNEPTSADMSPLDIWKNNSKQRCHSSNQINMIGLDANTSTANCKGLCNHDLKESRNACAAKECITESGVDHAIDSGLSYVIPAEHSANRCLLAQHRSKNSTSDAYQKHTSSTSPRLMLLKKTHKQKVIIIFIYSIRTTFINIYKL